MKKIKVAIYSGVIPSTTFIENLIKAVASINTEVVIFGNKRAHTKYEQEGIRIYSSPVSGIQLVPFAIYNLILLRFRSEPRYQLLKQHINKQSPGFKSRFFLWSKYLPIVLNLPDIFHVQWAKTCDEWMFLKDLFNVKLILSLRGAQIHYKPLADSTLEAKYKSLFPKIDGFHAVSSHIGKMAVMYGASPDKIRVIYSGLDFNTLNKYHKQLTSTAGQKLQIISVGRMHWNKGYHFALDALQKLFMKGYEFHYTIVAGLNAEEILYQIEDLGLHNHVTIVKGLEQEKLFEKMCQSDLLLLPSFKEGVANVVLEAMAIGLPVISSDGGGMPEVIKHKHNGYLYNKRNSGDLVSALESFINESVENKLAVTENAAKYVKQHHTLEMLGTKMNSFYTDVIRNKI